VCECGENQTESEDSDASQDKRDGENLLSIVRPVNSQKACSDPKPERGCDREGRKGNRSQNARWHHLLTAGKCVTSNKGYPAKATTE